jgi:hypothetical protein
VDGNRTANYAGYSGSTLKTDEFKDAGIREVGILMEIPIGMFLHKKHADLVPQLAETLKAMKAEEGLMEQLEKMAAEE